MGNGKPSMFEIYMKTMPKGMHPASFQGSLMCPWWGCGSTSFAYEGKTGPFMLLYKCKKCGQYTAYDVARQLGNPYIKDKDLRTKTLKEGLI